MSIAKKRQGYDCDNSCPSDAHYMKRIVDGDRTAFSEVVKIYMNDMYRFAYSMVGDVTKAEDIVQEACLRLWKKARQWQPSGRLKSWLLTIVHNLCVDELRKNKKDVPLELVVFNLPDERKSQLQKHQDWQNAQIISEALFTLPERQRTALMLVYYHSNSNREAADVMGVSVEALESLLARGRRKLKGLLMGSKNMLLEE